MQNFFNNLGGSIRNLIGMNRGDTSASPVTAPTLTSQSPQIGPIQPIVQRTNPVLSPIQPIQQNTNSAPFKIDTSNITSDHLGGDNTYAGVIKYAQDQQPKINPYQSNYDQYQQNVSPFQQQKLQSTQFSPDYLKAVNQQLNTNQGFRAGIEQIREKPIPLEFQQGQESALTRNTALTQQANAENLSLQEMIRQNNIETANTGIGIAQNNFQNAFNTTQAGLQNQIAQGNLDVSRTQTSQGRYEMQQIMGSDGLPSIQILDKQSGLPVGSVSPSSPMGQQIINSGQMITGSQNNGIINGYNITSYATDPNHEQAVNGLYQSINQATQQIGGVTTPNTAQQIINQFAPNSPVTGQMIMASAQKYGVDPALMISIMQQDSQMGTKGLAVRTFNPGNVGNDGTNIKNMGSWDKGVDSVAQWLSNHKDNGQNQNINSGTSNNSVYQQIKSTAPAQIASAIQPIGDSAYVDSSLLSDPKFGIFASTYAKQNGIPVLDSKYSGDLKTVQQSANNVQSLFDNFAQLAPHGLAGKTFDTLLSNGVSKVLGTDYGNNLKAFQANQDSVYQQVHALAGSAPRLSTPELGLAKSSLPNLSGVTKDTLEQGISKATLILQYHDNAIRKAIPNYAGTPLRINDNSYAVRLNDGKVYYYPSDAIAKQALKLNYKI